MRNRLRLALGYLLPHFLPRLLGLEARGHVRQRRRVQIIFQPLTDWLVQIVLGTGHLVIALIESDDATIETLRAFHDLDDLHEGNLVRRTRAGESAASTFGA